MSGCYDETVADLEERITPYASKDRRPAPRWISTPDGDLGSEWCSNCGYYKVRNLRRRDRKRAEDYLLDGGWRTEEEHFCFCAGCGVRLDVALTDYGVDAEIDHYRECGLSTEPAEDAYEIGEMLSSVSWRSEDEAGHEVKRRAAVVAIAERFLATTPPVEPKGDGG